MKLKHTKFKASAVNTEDASSIDLPALAKSVHSWEFFVEPDIADLEIDGVTTPEESADKIDFDEEHYEPTKRLCLNLLLSAALIRDLQTASQPNHHLEFSIIHGNKVGPLLTSTFAGFIDSPVALSSKLTTQKGDLLYYVEVDCAVAYPLVLE